MIPYISYELSAAICKPASQTGNQTGESNNPRSGTAYDVKRAEREPVTSRRFEHRCCGILMALILAIVVLVSFSSPIFGDGYVRYSLMRKGVTHHV